MTACINRLYVDLCTLYHHAGFLAYVRGIVGRLTRDSTYMP
nr:MAG TPA: hypothetical protein [Caudoviricetes sp.]